MGNFLTLVDSFLPHSCVSSYGLLTYLKEGIYASDTIAGQWEDLKNPLATISYSDGLQVRWLLKKLIPEVLNYQQLLMMIPEPKACLQTLCIPKHQFFKINVIHFRPSVRTPMGMWLAAFGKKRAVLDAGLKQQCISDVLKQRQWWSYIIAWRECKFPEHRAGGDREGKQQADPFFSEASHGIRVCPPHPLH